MLNRNARPHKKTILKLAEALQVEPAELWADLEVAELLDSTASFQEERQLTPTQADSLREALSRPAAKVKAQRHWSWGGGTARPSLCSSSPCSS